MLIFYRLLIVFISEHYKKQFFKKIFKKMEFFC